MPFANRTVQDLSSNVLKLSFMKPSLQAAEKAKVIKEDSQNKLNITFPLPENILKKINESYKNSFRKRETNLLVCAKLPRGLRLSYGGFNSETERQMMRKEINVNEYEESTDPSDEYSVSLDEMKEYRRRNHGKHHESNKRRSNAELEEGEIVSEHRSKRKRN